MLHHEDLKQAALNLKNELVTFTILNILSCI